MPISVSGSGAITGTSSINGLSMPSDAISPGLVHIISREINTSAGQVIKLTNLFSAKYDCYKIICDVRAKTGETGSFYYRAQLLQGTTATNTSYNFTLYQRTTAANNYYYYSDTAINLGLIEQYDYNVYTTDLIDPFLTKYTKNITLGGRGGIQELMVGYHSQYVSYDGISLSSSSTTGEIGTVYVYGYRK